MHLSRLCAVLIDCRTSDADGAARFWGKALGRSVDPSQEFMRRLLLHVLPAGFHRLRHYGLLATPTRKKNIEVARALLHVPAPRVPADPAPASSAPRPTFVCRHCGAPMLIIETLARAQHIRAPPALSASP
jgi:hypothetical protein